MSHSGAAIFRKSAGILSIDETKYPATIQWKSTDGTQLHSIELNQVSKLQATPANSTKMMLKLIGKLTPEQIKEGIKEPVSVFQFNNRMVMDSIKETLQIIIARYKDNEAYEQKMEKEKEADSIKGNASNLINTETLDDSLTISNLLSNLQLQQQFLKSHPEMSKKFQEAVIKNKLPAKEFWATRISELRSFALSNSQKFGPYNVLSTIKPVASSDNKVNVSVTKEKLGSILITYPIVRVAFEENVPKHFHEQEFWARFFQSNLFRKLRGELIMAKSRGDVIIDKYLEREMEMNNQEDRENLSQVKVSKILDLEGNLEDDPVKFPSKLDFTMRYGSDPQGQTEGVLDILKGMNRLSEKLMNSLQNEYGRSKKRKREGENGEEIEQNGDGDEMEDRLDNEDGFNDLKKQKTLQYTEIQLQEHIAGNEQENRGNNTSTSTSTSQIIDNISILEERMGKQLDNISRLITNELKEPLYDTLSDRYYAQIANKNILNILEQNQTHYTNSTDTNSSSFIVVDVNYKKMGISQELFDSCSNLNETCNEFLKHFYHHLNTIDPRRSMIIRRLNKHLISCDVKLTEICQANGNAHVPDFLKPVRNAVKMSLDKFKDAEEK
ncbi:hypothetical protein ACO0SA_004704 [Hanseniaspora valbyensis]